MIAAVRVRGSIGTKKSIEDTLRMLKLYRKNYCVLLNEEPHKMGMLQKVKDFVTWGSIDAETQKKLESRPGKQPYRLNNPRKGFGRKGIKETFANGGALGDRKEKINDLLKRMT